MISRLHRRGCARPVRNGGYLRVGRVADVVDVDGFAL